MSWHIHKAVRINLKIILEEWNDVSLLKKRMCVKKISKRITSLLYISVFNSKSKTIEDNSLWDILLFSFCVEIEDIGRKQKL